MISQSQDGELISDACKALGYLTARGSSGKGGSKAVRDMIKLSKIHNLALTPDGPKGPPQTFKDGLVFVAKATKLPIVLVTADVSREVVFNSWDRFRLPLPFTKILVNYSQPFSVPRDADKMEVINSLTELMNKLEDETVITR